MIRDLSIDSWSGFFHSEPTQRSVHKQISVDVYRVPPLNATP